MQTSIYYTQNDKYLIDQLEKKAKAERKSKSAVVLCILEEYFERKKKVGEILCDIGSLTNEQLNEALKIQQREKKHRLLGEILVNKNFVDERDLERALSLQGNGGS